MTFQAATLMCVSRDRKAAFDVFVRTVEEMPRRCQFCGRQMQVTCFPDQGTAPDEDGDDVPVVVVSSPLRREH